MAFMVDTPRMIPSEYPATCPSSTEDKLSKRRVSRVVALTLAKAPVERSLEMVWYPVTTTSSKVSLSGSSLKLITSCLPKGISMVL